MSGDSDLAGLDRPRYCLSARNLMREYMGESRCLGYGCALERWLAYWLDYWRGDKRELHALCFDDPLLARSSDQLVSMWCPLKANLQLSSSSPWYGSRGIRRGPCKSKSMLGDIEAHLSEYLPASKFPQIYRLAELAEFDVNVWCLPNTSMQRRGGRFYDQIIPSVAALFSRDDYGAFLGQTSVTSYIEGEGLGFLFDGGEIALRNLRPAVMGIDPARPIWPSSEDELNELLDSMISLLAQRNELFLSFAVAA